MTLREKITAALLQFGKKDFYDAGLNLFNLLGYNTSRTVRLDDNTFEGFADMFIQDLARFNADKAMVNEWSQIEFLFQLSESEMSSQIDMFDTKEFNGTIIESYAFFAIELKGETYTRSQLAQVTREFNKLFDMPAMLIFKHGSTLTLSVINRRLHKRDKSKDVLEKVTLIKDIRAKDPHRAHVEILVDLSFEELHRKYSLNNFVALHEAWTKCLDSKELSKRFYQELANWYFWAMDKVSFPDDIEKDQDVRNATNLIRLITRIIFVWFIKEKGLVPEVLFNRNQLSKILKDFIKNSKSHSYYQAILQNLFFGTLNQKMKERAFAKDSGYPANKNEYGVKNLFRYEDKFTLNETEVLALFADIPFLNGGLFDCLDKEDENKKVIYVDGFSREQKKQAILPDYLFFHEEQDVDLNEIYGTRNKKYRVKGLIDLLDSYKFTITENTPLEEEIALDPELLGKVFENLLASYNPETQTTARKQTGSFYTPREIVNYMVDESLLAYLKQKLEENKYGDCEGQLRQLLSYSEEPHSFNEQQTDLLIKAIDDCKILDPACGSGAFPMGMLLKLVHVLHKLDPENEKWKEQQIVRVDNFIKGAETIPDAGVREKVIHDLQQTLQDIEESFNIDNNELDYGRKLFLIENCIYGVDIQPIAVQIAKLRFFISLVIDQKKQPSKENLGIRSLPNLETKFVAADTLIELEKPSGQGMLRNLEIVKLENELKELRHQYFNARTRKEKLQFQKKDKDLRQEIAHRLVEDGWPNSIAQQIVAFNPYDQNSSSPFFDPEWMFGITDGFDIIIGNPPWGAHLSLDYKKRLKEIYPEIDSSTPNSFAYFIGNVVRYYKSCISYVLPDSILIKDYSKSRMLISPYLKIVNWYQNIGVPEELRPFVYVEHDVCVFLIEKKKNIDLSYSRFEYNTHSKAIVEVNKISSKENIIQEEFDYAFNLTLNDQDLAILDTIRKYNKLSDFLQCHEGIHTGNARNILFHSNKINKYCKPLYYGGSAGDIIENYCSKMLGWYVDYRTEIIDKKQGYYASLRDERIFKLPKIYITRTGNPFKAFYDEDSYASNNFFSLQFIDYSNNTKDELKVILPFIISPISQYFIRRFAAPRLGSIFVETKIQHLLKFRIPSLTVNTKNTIRMLVDYVLLVKSVNGDGRLGEYYQALLQSIIYELYFLKEVEVIGANVLYNLDKLPDIQPLIEKGETEKALKTIEKVYREFSAPEHPVSIAMSRMQEIEEVQIIEGRK